MKKQKQMIPYSAADETDHTHVSPPHKAMHYRLAKWGAHQHQLVVKYEQDPQKQKNSSTPPGEWIFSPCPKIISPLNLRQKEIFKFSKIFFFLFFPFPFHTELHFCTLSRVKMMMTLHCRQHCSDSSFDDVGSFISVTAAGKIMILHYIYVTFLRRWLSTLQFQTTKDNAV